MISTRSARPLSRKRIGELEELYRGSGDEPEILEQILHELGYRRQNKRNKGLAVDVHSRLQELNPGVRREQDNEPGEGASRASIASGPPADPGDRSEWEKNQRTVIEYDSAGSLLVDAGPGSGKTHVACHRVAQFINTGIDASQILLISFTRAAIKELRERIEAFANEKSAVTGLKIITLDSFTWEILRGLSDNEPASLLKGYNENIQTFIQLLDNPTSDLRNFLDELEHVIVDEAQDLIADRADLVIRLIQKLPDCGFTVFADPAQSIYGFTSDDEDPKAQGSLTLVDRIQKKEVAGFSNKELKGNFRTADPGLITLFSVIRQRLLGKDQSDKNSWLELKADIEKMASGTVPAVAEQEFDNEIETLVLCRTRAEVLQGSSFLRSGNIPHKIRMSGIHEIIHPWIGRVFSEFCEDSISQSEFNDLWRKRIAGSTAVLQVEKEPAAAWKLLEAHAWDRGKVSVRRLREILIRLRPPVDFIVDEKTLPGPVIGTIHSSKGREADHVHLMLPPDSYVDGDRFTATALAEEERVMFVGATRARTKLLCGEGARTFSSRLASSGRVFRSTRNRNSSRFQFEVGLRDDIDYDSIISKEIISKESGCALEDLADIQNWLWMQRVAVLPVYSTYEKPDNELWCTHDGEDIWVGNFSQTFRKDLYALAGKMSEHRGTRMNPPGKIPHLWMVGVTTRIVPPDVREAACAPYRNSGFMLAPVVTGYPTVRFFPAGYSSAD